MNINQCNIYIYIYIYIIYIYIYIYIYLYIYIFTNMQWEGIQNYHWCYSHIRQVTLDVVNGEKHKIYKQLLEKTRKPMDLKFSPFKTSFLATVQV